MNIHDLIMQPVYNPRVKSLVHDLRKGILTDINFHNKKSYAKRSENILLVIDLAIAWEIYKIGEESEK